MEKQKNGHADGVSRRFGPRLLLRAWGVVFLVACSCFLGHAQDQWHIETIDGGTGRPIGGSPSLAIDNAGNFHLGYVDSSRNILRYAYRGKNEKKWDKMDVDSAGYSEALAVDASGRPHFAYQGPSENGLHYSFWDGTSWHKQMIDPLSVAFFLSIQVNSQGHPRISYYHRFNPDGSYALQLKYAFFDGSAWYRETVDQTMGTGKMNSLALDAEGNPHIVYSNLELYEVEYVRWDGSQWMHSTPESRRTSSETGNANGIAVDSSGNPSMVYMDLAFRRLKYARRRGASWETEVVEQMAGNADQADRIAMKLDRQNRPHLAYVDYTRNQLKYAVRTEHGWQIEVVDANGGSYATPSLALDATDAAYIAYYDEIDGSLRLAYLQSALRAMTSPQP